MIDIFPAEAEKEAIRIELEFDKVVNISYFDPLTGSIYRDVPRVTIFPKTHYVTPQETIDSAIEQIKTELDERLIELKANNKLLEAQRLEERTNYDLEMMAELGYCNGVENYSRYLSGRKPGEAPPCLFDYVPKNAIVFMDESHVSVPQIGGMFKGDRSRKETLVEYGFRLPSALDNRPLKFEEWNKLAPQEYLFQQHLENGKKKTQTIKLNCLLGQQGLLILRLKLNPPHIKLKMSRGGSSNDSKRFQNIDYNSHKKNGRGFNRLLIRKRFTCSIYAL